MRGSLWIDSDRRELLERIERLVPDARPLWGKMSALQMITHLSEWFQMARGELATAPRRNFMRYPIIREIVIRWVPFPKGVPTAPELLVRTASGWEDEHASLRSNLESFVELKSKKKWPAHPVFGTISPADWGILGYRHTDHHLRQFGR